MKKKCEVVMVATDNTTQPVIFQSQKGLSLDFKRTPSSMHHLYILSDDEIKEGDYHFFEGEVCITTKQTMSYLSRSGDQSFKRVIATSNQDLKTFSGEYSRVTVIGQNGDPEHLPINMSIPQIPQSFIEEYIKKYNEGNPITEVMVEYQDYCDYEGEELWEITPDLRVKTDNDNCILITPVKDNWAREEVEKLIKKCANYFFQQGMIESRPYSRGGDNDSTKWITENL